MKRERIKEIINENDIKKPDNKFIFDLCMDMLECAGVSVSVDEFVNDYANIISNSTITLEQYTSFKIKAFEKMVEELNYPLQKCEAEFGYFYINYGIQNIEK